VLHNMNTAMLATRTPTPTISPDSAAVEQAKKTAIGLSKEEISRMLQHGAYALFHDDKENEEASATFCEEDINQILERRSKRMVWVNDVQGSMFSKATFKINEDGPDVDVNAPDFWEKVIPSAMTPKMLFDHFTKLITSDDAEKENWMKNKKLSFMNNLSDQVAEVVRSFSDAKGALLADRDTLKSVLLLCIDKSALFSSSEMKDLNKWLDDIDYGRRRRQSKPANDFSELNEPPPTRANPTGHRGRPRLLGSTATVDVDAGMGSDSDDDEEGDFTKDRDGTYGMPTYKPHYKTRGRPRLNKRPRSGGDDDYEGDSDFGDDDDADGFGGMLRQTSKRNQVGKQRTGKGPWSSTERHLLYDAVFSIGRPDWYLILKRSRLAPRPVIELQEVCIQLMKHIEARARDSWSVKVFSSMAEEFESARMETIPPYANGKKDRRSLEEIQALIELSPSDEKVLIDAIDRRILGWTRRMLILNGLRNEIKIAQENGKTILEGTKNGELRNPSKWWIHDKHDKDLLIGIHKHGWGAWDSVIYDKELSFYEVIKATFPECFGQADGATEDPDNLDPDMDDDAGPSEDVIKTRRAKRPRGRVPTHGIAFHNYVGWPAGRTMEHYVQTLIDLSEKTRKKAEKKAKKAEKKAKKSKHHHHHKSHHSKSKKKEENKDDEMKDDGEKKEEEEKEKKEEEKPEDKVEKKEDDKEEKSGEEDDGSEEDGDESSEEDDDDNDDDEDFDSDDISTADEDEDDNVEDNGDHMEDGDHKEDKQPPEQKEK